MHPTDLDGSWKGDAMKFLHVDMTRQQINVEDVPEDYIGLGGRGLTSILINAEVPPDCDPLGPDNKLIFAPGTLMWAARLPQPWAGWALPLSLSKVRHQRENSISLKLTTTAMPC
jgi:hypothetical protein